MNAQEKSLAKRLGIGGRLSGGLNTSSAGSERQSFGSPAHKLLSGVSLESLELAIPRLGTRNSASRGTSNTLRRINNDANQTRFALGHVLAGIKNVAANDFQLAVEWPPTLAEKHVNSANGNH